MLLSETCRLLGDDDGAEMELDAARSTFDRLGALPDLARISSMSGAENTEAPTGLTAHEVEVLRLVAKGKTSRAIADELIVSEKTVASHLSHIFTKLDLTSRAAATAFAYENGLSLAAVRITLAHGYRHRRSTAPARAPVGRRPHRPDRHRCDARDSPRGRDAVLLDLHIEWPSLRNRLLSARAAPPFATSRLRSVSLSRRAGLASAHVIGRASVDCVPGTTSSGRRAEPRRVASHTATDHGWSPPMA